MKNNYFEQIAKRKYEEIQLYKESLDAWLQFWAITKCPYKIGEIVTIKGYTIEVQYVTTFWYTPNGRYEWIIKGWTDIGNNKMEYISINVEIKDED